MLEVCKLVRFNGNGRNDDTDNCGGHFQLLLFVVAVRDIETWPHKDQSLLE
jgi:hypothetical protein